MSVSTRHPQIGIEGVVYAVLIESSDVVGGTPVYGPVGQLAGAMKFNMKPNGQLATLYADDFVAFVANSVGKRQVSLDLYDVLPAAYAAILGMSLQNGAYVESSLDQSPYVAIGYKVLLAGLDGNGNKIYRYRWLLKGKFAKPDEGADTKADTIKYQQITMTAEFADLFATKTYQTVIPRIDDPAIPATFLANFFNQPVLSTGADLSALSCAIAKSGTTITFTFSKLSGAPFSLNEASAIVSGSILVSKAGALQAGTVAFAGEGTASVVATFTPSVAFGTTTVLAAVTDDLEDANGVNVTPAVASLSYP
jgi:phi13 family phage major tail protein